MTDKTQVINWRGVCVGTAERYRVGEVSVWIFMWVTNAARAMDYVMDDFGELVPLDLYGPCTVYA